MNIITYLEHVLYMNLRPGPGNIHLYSAYSPGIHLRVEMSYISSNMSHVE